MTTEIDLELARLIRGVVSAHKALPSWISEANSDSLSGLDFAVRKLRDALETRGVADQPASLRDLPRWLHDLGEIEDDFESVWTSSLPGHRAAVCDGHRLLIVDDASVNATGRWAGESPDSVQKTVEKVWRGDPAGTAVVPVSGLMGQTGQVVIGPAVIDASKLPRWLPVRLAGDETVEVRWYGSDRDPVAFYGRGWRTLVMPFVASAQERETLPQLVEGWAP
jgi:hypothetical protein